MNQIKFPAHTQARMAATKAAKAPKPVADVAQVAQAATITPLTRSERKPRGLPGHMDSLNSNERRAILQSSDRVAIAYGTAECPVVLVDMVNLAMLRHCKCCSTHAPSLTLPTSQDTQASDRAPEVANKHQTSPTS